METSGFLAQALIYLAAAVIAVPVIGDVEAMLHFSEFGVVLLQSEQQAPLPAPGDDAW